MNDGPLEENLDPLGSDPVQGGLVLAQPLGAGLEDELLHTVDGQVAVGAEFLAAFFVESGDEGKLAQDEGEGGALDGVAFRSRRRRKCLNC